MARRSSHSAFVLLAGLLATACGAGEPSSTSAPADDTTEITVNSSEDSVPLASLGLTPSELPIRDPKRIMVLGGSAIAQLAPAMQSAFEPYGAEFQSWAGPALVAYGETGPLADPSEEWPELVKEFAPDVVIVQTMMQMPEIRCAQEDEETCIRAGRQAGLEILFERMARDLAAGGAHVIWMESPEVGEGYGERYDEFGEVSATVNDAARAVAARRSYFTSVDISPIVDINGTFTLWKERDGRFYQVRSSDGLYMCQPGVEWVVESFGYLLFDQWGSQGDSWRQAGWRYSNSFASPNAAEPERGCQDIPRASPGSWTPD